MLYMINAETFLEILISFLTDFLVPNVYLTQI